MINKSNNYLKEWHMAFSLKGKRTLVTGGTAGIGLAVAKRFVDNGADVVISGRREAGAEIAARIGARFIRADMMVETDVANLVDQAVEALGGLDVVVNNAGIAESPGPITKTGLEYYDSQFGINVRAAFQILSLVPKHMQAGGSIINTASISGTQGEPGLSAYGATKAALISLTKTSALELAARNIRVNAVNPGPIFSEIWSEGAPVDATKYSVPLGRVGEADEAAAPFHFLASDDASYITGAQIAVDGGLCAGKSIRLGELVNDKIS
jgi:NAD(P)-dependent dehydrogenase (short-subunit alcohol dehydrogenase family)